MADSPKKVRYAVVGLGHIAQAAVLPAFENAENSELVAIVSGDGEKRRAICARYGLEHAFTYDEFDSLLEQKLVDAVYIALPNDLHCDYTVRAANAGLHVLCEKPMAVTEQQCERMIAAAEKNDVRLMIAYRLHFDAANLEAIDAARRGDLGDLRFFTSTFSQNVVDGDIRLSPLAEGGGSVYDMGIYCINAARYLFGDEPIEVIARSESRAGDPRFAECDEMTSVVMRFAGERIASFTSSFGAGAVSTYRLVGTDGELVMDPAFEYATHLGYALKANGKSRARTFEKRDQFGPELVYFSDCVLNGRHPEPDGYEGWADVRIIEAIYESARTGKAVAIEPIEQSSRPDLRQKITRPGFDKPDEIKASSPKEP
ncbi:MAG: Gfo/Idh/MocA family oxidoreductase [Bradymonadaceae bacterium]|nr:Gfo/Idh/MocA family oxidoreductase [Lujinxingiaceae bacterium]